MKDDATQETNTRITVKPYYRETDKHDNHNKMTWFKGNTSYWSIFTFPTMYEQPTAYKSVPLITTYHTTAR